MPSTPSCGTGSPGDRGTCATRRRLWHCSSSREAGMKSNAIDAFVWHKFRDPQGNLIACREDSPKIAARWGDGFMAEFNPSADYVEKKWSKYRPFQTTSW